MRRACCQAAWPWVLAEGRWEVHPLPSPCFLKGSRFPGSGLGTRAGPIASGWVPAMWCHSTWLRAVHLQPVEGDPWPYCYVPREHRTLPYTLSMTVWSVYIGTRCHIIDVANKKAAKHQKLANIYSKVVENQIKCHQRIMEPGAAIVLIIRWLFGKVPLAFQWVQKHTWEIATFMD